MCLSCKENIGARVNCRLPARSVYFFRRKSAGCYSFYCFLRKIVDGSSTNDSVMGVSSLPPKWCKSYSLLSTSCFWYLQQVPQAMLVVVLLLLRPVRRAFSCSENLSKWQACSKCSPIQQVLFSFDDALYAKCLTPRLERAGWRLEQRLQCLSVRTLLLVCCQVSVDAIKVPGDSR